MLAVQVAEHLWYRTPDISPDVIWNKFLPSLNSLGQVTLQPTGDTRLILPAPRKRHITLLYPDARPAIDANITISIYLWNTNHCGFHEGLPLGTFRTDRTGTIEVLAPRASLYLDGVRYYEEVGTGPAGVAYSDNFGLKTGLDPSVTGLELMIHGLYSVDAPEARGKSYALGEGELHQLFTKHQLTIRW